MTEILQGDAPRCGRCGGAIDTDPGRLPICCPRWVPPPRPSRPLARTLVYWRDLVDHVVLERLPAVMGHSGAGWAYATLFAVGAVLLFVLVLGGC